jgi:hypothetical protein
LDPPWRIASLRDLYEMQNQFQFDLGSKCRCLAFAKGASAVSSRPKPSLPFTMLAINHSVVISSAIFCSEQLPIELGRQEIFGKQQFRNCRE